MAITFEPREMGLSYYNITPVHSLRQELSVNTKHFDLVTLTLTYDLPLKKA